MVCQKVELITKYSFWAARHPFREYIHYNPVRHGLVNAVKDWQYSSFHRYVEKGIYAKDWGVSENIIFDGNIGME